MKLKKTALFLAAVITFVSVFMQSTFAFSDVNPSEWYADNINKMVSLGLLSGYEDGSFRPNAVVTYAEFISIVKRCTAGESTSPTIGSHWASENMKYAYSSGWYDYDEIFETDFDKPIPRQMAAKITALAFKLPENEHENNAYYYYMTNINDFNDIPGRYAYLVIRAYCSGILTGDENRNFNPKSSLTRAEACAIIMRAKNSAFEQPTSQQSALETPVPIQNYIKGGVSQNGALTVNGTQLCNQIGEPIVLSGMSSHGIQWYSNYTSYASIKNTSDFGANVFRIAMYTAENGYISQKDNIKQTVYSAVDNAVMNDMYVIIDWHILSDGNPLTYLNEAKEFFAEVSAKYADVPNVIYEICNEPNGNVTWAGNVKPYAEQIIPIIRQNTNAVILVGSPTWSQDVDAAADDPLNFNNIMYTCHFYAGTHSSNLRDKIDYALSKNAPIFVSEWGTSAADGSGGIYLSQAEEWINFLNSRGISRVNWSLCNKNESSAALSPNTNPNSAWSENDLSESGKFVFNNF